ncbi:MAG: hypothetical protein ACXWV5_06025 [Flavitalea sp.]
MDFALAPGLTRYDRALRRLYVNRASTTSADFTVIDNFRMFISFLNRTPAARPLHQMHLASHGDDNAYMAMKYDMFTTGIKWENLDASQTAGRDQVNDNVIVPRPLDPATNNPIPPFLLIKGCRIGQSLPFLNKFKDVINGTSTVTIGVAAPKFYHLLLVGAQGIFETFTYDFSVFSKTRFANKNALKAALVAKPYRDIHNNLITDAQYETWIPARIHTETESLHRITINPSPVPNLARMSGGRYKYKLVDVLTYTMDTTGNPFPAAEPDRIIYLKAKLAGLPTQPGANAFAQSLASTHAFPFYTRYGYTSLDNMVDNLEWTWGITQNSPTVVAVGRRHEYNVNPVTCENGNNNIIFNYYADAGSGTTSVRNFDDRDARFYNTV